ncbi:MAG: hypothetical protein R3192_11910 [Woeseiaceae bacterium]|nr:hypothetical protein [Woeseiaceae bacterium]
MTRLLARTFASLVAAHASLGLAQNNELPGDWTIVTSGFSFVGTNTAVLNLTVENEDGELRAYVYNGPVALRTEGNRFEIDVDWRSGFDVEYLATFKGEIKEDGTLEGEMTHNGARNFLGRPWQDGTFTGTRSEPRPELDGLAPAPVDFSGVWNRAFGKWGINKIYYTMTDQGQAIMDDYLEMDNPNSRCASPGLVLASGLPYPMEILHTDDYIVIVYGADYARRIYLDGREFPEDATSSSLGFSRGEWKGETLVVTTTRLNPAFMSTRGQPVSGDAQTIEHFYFDDKGYLHGDMWLHDPKNYARPPYLRRVYDRDFSPSVISKIDCDPFTFFRALYLEGELETFWQRARFRR